MSNLSIPRNEFSNTTSIPQTTRSNANEINQNNLTVVTGSTQSKVGIAVQKKKRKITRVPTIAEGYMLQRNSVK